MEQTDSADTISFKDMEVWKWLFYWIAWVEIVGPIQVETLIGFLGLRAWNGNFWAFSCIIALPSFGHPIFFLPRKVRSFNKGRNLIEMFRASNLMLTTKTRVMFSLLSRDRRGRRNQTLDSLTKWYPDLKRCHVRYSDRRGTSHIGVLLNNFN